MIWSSTHYGHVWRNDPKEIFAMLTWLLYFVLIIYRSSTTWRGRNAAWLGVVGFGLVLFTYLGTRLLGGYHVFG
jgi:ABC-type transport system involved in cytochrome c biogenesis permease subunit